VRPTLVLCAKSPWRPAVRREHALAALAAEHGHRVIYLERPRDVRSLRGDDRRGWVAGLAGRPERHRPAAGIEVIRLSALAPGHRNGIAERLHTRVLGRALAEVGGDGATIVAMTPWQWPATSAARPARVVFDAADDWTMLIERRREAFRPLYHRIAREADTIVTVAPSLNDLFPDASPVVIRNGTPRELLAPPLAPPPADRGLVYVGTLSENFDAPLLQDVLERLPGWRLDLWGQCQYAGLGDRPAPELRRLLDSADGRAVLHGVLPRSKLPSVLDGARVAIVPLRGRGGRDTMKLFDYAARGRPIVTTDWNVESTWLGPPRVYHAQSAAEFAAAVVRAENEPETFASERRAWAERESWDSRWPALFEALFGRT
jgi:glycosyltransferase involved in cell wall biosynthesis